MSRILIFLLILVLSGTSAHAEFLWQNVGGNPYRGSNATVGRALDFWLGVPDSVRMDLLVKVLRGEKSFVSIAPGERFDFVTFGNGEAISDVITAWPDRRLYAAEIYVVRNESTTYALYRVFRCGNWAGKIIKEDDHYIPPEAAEPQSFLRGDIPTTNCGTGSVYCASCQ